MNVVAFLGAVLTSAAGSRPAAAAPAADATDVALEAAARDWRARAAAQRRAQPKVAAKTPEAVAAAARAEVQAAISAAERAAYADAMVDSQGSSRSAVVGSQIAAIQRAERVRKSRPGRARERWREGERERRRGRGSEFTPCVCVHAGGFRG